MGTDETVRRAPSISQYWDTEEVPADVKPLLDSFRDRNPEMEHRLFSEGDAERFIASRFGRRELDAFRACAIPAMQADYFRYCAVLSCGGLWADADLHCRRNLGPLLESSDGVVFLRPDRRSLGGREARRMENAIFCFSEPGHPFLELTVEIATANIEERLADEVWPVGEHVREAIGLTTGQGIFTLLRYLRDWGSFDALIDGLAGTFAAPFAPRFCELVGDYGRVEEAMEGVRVATHAERREWATHPTTPPAYKATDRHWLNAERAIFR